MRILKIATEGRLYAALLSALYAALLLGTATAAQPAEARNVKYDLDIPSQSLNNALQALALASRHKLLYSSELVDGKTSPTLKGQFTTEQAVKALLVGTNLWFEVTSDGLVLIRAPDQAPRTNLAPAVSGDNPQGTDSDTQEERKNEGLTEIVVTGTHIHGIDNKVNQVIVIDRDQIERSGFSSTQDLLRSLPQNFSSGDANADGQFGSDPNRTRNGDFSTGVNLRGLGTTSTLVLLNGHRMVPSAFGTVADVSSIPLAAIERVEIVTEGSSAIYGSDAVGGVVNIILKKDYRGADTTVRFGSVTDGSRHEELVAQTLGTNWSGGNVAATLQYQKQSALTADEREFASALGNPSFLLPQTQSYAATLDGRQTLFDRLDLLGDMLLSKRQYSSIQNTIYSIGTDANRIDGNTQNITVAPGLRYELSTRWSLDLNALYGQQKLTSLDFDMFPFSPALISTTDNKFTEKSIEVLASGHVRGFSAGDIGVALGASYRRENLDSLGVSTPGPATSSLATVIEEGRHVQALFGEIFVPIVGDGSEIPMVKALELSASARLDKYSDFGSTTNPRIGVRWAPLRDVFLRASYSKSFRAPSAVDEFTAAPNRQQIYVYPFDGAAGPGTVPTLVLNGSRPLTAERARIADAGIEYRPVGIRGLNLALDYYHVVYRDRIATPPFATNALQQQNIYGAFITPIPSDAAAQAIVDAAVASGAIYNDYIGTGQAGVRYMYDDRQQNASSVIQSGLDVSSKFIGSFGSHTLTTQLNVAYIQMISTAFALGIPAINLVNTFGNPVRWRGRLDTSWSSRDWSLSGALNSAGSYTNNTIAGNPPIASWTTVDLNATWNVESYLNGNEWQGFSVSLVALNVLNRQPPYVDGSSQFVQVNYDPTNGSPLGRFLALSLRKKW